MTPARLLGKGPCRSNSSRRLTCWSDPLRIHHPAAPLCRDRPVHQLPMTTISRLAGTNWSVAVAVPAIVSIPHPTSRWLGLIAVKLFLFVSNQRPIAQFAGDAVTWIRTAQKYRNRCRSRRTRADAPGL